jgi:hypothetical protein
LNNLNAEDGQNEACQDQDLKINENIDTTSFNLNYGDPATWANLWSKYDDRVRQILVKRGPEQVQQSDFPKEGNQRKFSTSHYKRRLENGKEMHCQWLQYSMAKESAFCFCCKLFTSSTIGVSSLSGEGSKDWKICLQY